MMKKILALLLTVLCLCIPITVFAENSVILDDSASLINDSYEEKLTNRMQEIANKYSINFIILTTENTDGKTLQDYADDYYDQLFNSENGFTIAININTREIYASGVGTGVDNISDYEIDSIFDSARSYLSDGDFDSAFAQMLDTFDYYYSYDDTQDIEEYLYDDGNQVKEKSFGLGNIGISGIIGAISSFITGLVLKKDLKSVAPKKSASEYGKDLVITGMSDFYLGSHVSKTPIVKNNNNNSGSHGNYGGGHSVHISSSGVSHGGHSSHF